MCVVPLQMILQHEVRFSQTFHSLLSDSPQTFSIQVRKLLGLMLDHYNLSCLQHFQMKILTDQIVFFFFYNLVWNLDRIKNLVVVFVRACLVS